VLVAVSGLTPQIITETFYALAVGAPQAERFIPTEVQILTTVEGARRIRAQLLEPQEGAFWNLLKEYALPDCLFGDEQIHIAQRPDGSLLDDIRDDADNTAMANTISGVLQRLTSDGSCAVHVSLAGGRKTMGYYAGYALSLYGRDQDRLSHVLVQQPFEGLRDFYYPTRITRWLALPDGGRADASAATITLAVIPFLRLRQGIPRALLDGTRSFAQTIEATRPSLAPPHLTLQVADHSIVAEGQWLNLKPAEFAIYAVLAHRALAGKAALHAPMADVHDVEWSKEFLSDLRAALGRTPLNDSFAESIQTHCSASKVSPHISRLRSTFKEHLPPSRLMHYFDDGNTSRNKRYQIPLPPAAITFVIPAPEESAASLQPGPQPN
jgi:CRISPR-associated protein (TIGR02584 family)